MVQHCRPVCRPTLSARVSPALITQCTLHLWELVEITYKIIISLHTLVHLKQTKVCTVCYYLSLLSTHYTSLSSSSSLSSSASQKHSAMPAVSTDSTVWTESICALQLLLLDNERLPEVDRAAATCQNTAETHEAAIHTHEMTNSVTEITTTNHLYTMYTRIARHIQAQPGIYTGIPVARNQ